MLSMWVAELTAFQRSKVFDIDDDTYLVMSCYKYFSLKCHETYAHSSEQCVSISKQCDNV
jgi:predicted nucleic-acid-binding Zn-ribbon protein